jgi:hypothetical protein
MRHTNNARKKDEEETFFFGLLRSSKSGAISIRGIHDAIDDEVRDEADESDDEQEDCEADEEEEEDDAAASPEVEEEEAEKSDPDLDAASTFFFTPVEGESDDDDDARNALECESARTSFCLPSAVDVFQDGRHDDDTDEEEKQEQEDGIFWNSYLSFPQAQEESSKTGRRKAAEMIANGGSSSSLNDASTSDSTTELGLAPANVHIMGEAFFQREDMELPIWPSISPNVRRLSTWKTLYYVCILYASTSVMKWYQMYSKDASFMDFPAPSLLHAIRFTFHAVISILIRHHWSITSSSPSISWPLYFQKGTEFDCPFHKQLIHQSSNLIKAQNPCICGAALLIHSLTLDGCNTLTSDMFIVNASLFIALNSCDLL